MYIFKYLRSPPGHDSFMNHFESLRLLWTNQNRPHTNGRFWLVHGYIVEKSEKLKRKSAGKGAFSDLICFNLSRPNPGWEKNKRANFKSRRLNEKSIKFWSGYKPDYCQVLLPHEHLTVLHIRLTNPPIVSQKKINLNFRIFEFSWIAMNFDEFWWIFTNSYLALFMGREMVNYEAMVSDARFDLCSIIWWWWCWAVLVLRDWKSLKIFMKNPWFVLVNWT